MGNRKQNLIDNNAAHERTICEDETLKHPYEKKGNGMRLKNIMSATFTEEDADDKTGYLYREMEDLYREEENCGSVKAP